MDPIEKALFESHALLQAHLNLLQGLVSQALGREKDLLEQVERVKQAAEVFARLPRPQRQAA